MSIRSFDVLTIFKSCHQVVVTVTSPRVTSMIYNFVLMQNGFSMGEKEESK